MTGKRTPGRPLHRTSTDLRPAIIDAAVRCYSQRGVAATALKHIAGEAGVTPALLHYYFGSREHLQQAVLDERVLPLLKEVQQQLGPGGLSGSPEALVRRFISAVSATVDRHPWWPPLWTREVLLEGGVFRAPLIERTGKQFFQQIVAAFSAAKDRGELPPDIDPRLLLVSLVGLTLFPAAAAPVWRNLMDTRDIDSQAMERHTLALVSQGIGGHHA